MIECILIESDNYTDSKRIRKELDRVTRGRYLVFSNLIRRQILDHQEVDKIRKLCAAFPTLLIYVKGLEAQKTMGDFIQNELDTNGLKFKSICRVEKATEEFTSFNQVMDHIITTYKLETK